jgi:hypothetical protein
MMFDASNDDGIAEIAALRAENERLKDWCRKLIKGGTFPGEADDLRARIAELEEAQKQWVWQEYLDPHTIERCAQVAEQSGGFPTYYIDAEKVAAAIRALKDKPHEPA